VPTHALEEIAATTADFASRTHATPSKTSAQGVEALRGGGGGANSGARDRRISVERVAEMWGAGAAGVAVIRAILSATDVAAATRALRTYG
jgi:hypothetical protein